MGEGGAGLLASIDDDPAYAAALAVFIGQPEIRANFSRKASERARNLFEATKIVDRLKQIYLEVL
jgi:glycosyltransferase involved in cell wall biosynthesis